MKPPEEVKRGLVQEWLAKANEDLAVARYLMGGSPPFLNTVGFHSQQAAEKYLKAYLVWRQIDFPKTHNIASLLKLISQANAGLSESLHRTIGLSKHGVDARYPADIPELSHDDANTALELAQMAQSEVLAALEEDGYRV